MRFRFLLFTMTLGTLSALANSITYTDNTLLIANYTITQGLSNGTVSFSNAGGAFTADRTINSGGGFANFAAMNSAFFYNPITMGTLNSIDVGALLTTTISPWALYIQQGSTFYRAAIATPTGTNQPSSATGLLAANFAEINLVTNTFGAGTPDFAQGFTLGFGQRLFTGGAITNSISFDNLSITLNVTPNAIPEPSSILLCGAGVLALAMRMRSRR